MPYISIASGHAGLDAFLADRFHQIPGMSSRFAAAICGHVVQRQTACGVLGDICEVGTFEGRFFIAMALALAPGEHALGIDEFNWPDPEVHGRFLRNCAASGLSTNSYSTWKINSRDIAAATLRARLPSGAARFIHIDGEHSSERLSQDLELAHAVMAPAGVIALDDMLHPGYPTLITAVLTYLHRHPEMCVFCIIDRESITAAAKFLICNIERADDYEQDLMRSFAVFHYVPAADLMGRTTLVLTPEPHFPQFG